MVSKATAAFHLCDYVQRGWQAAVVYLADVAWSFV